ncbi:hypothetical protein [Caballeronia sp. ATUFL_M2_KS44]|uniref:hypothetical protein n=1 Tax=Caballeronia sp. ATUFL_M2_KS44 TaxID=2921767 RepID=UPI002028C5F4|nr:hypothetical protein [Caballeronia sp. ATUFL_M2_KS44]
MLGKIFKPKAPASLPDGAGLRFVFGSDIARSQQRQAEIAGMPLADALQRVKRELSALRAKVDAATGLPSVATLHASIEAARKDGEQAGQKWTLMQRKFHGGACEYPDVLAAAQESHTAGQRVQDLSASLQKRQSADAAQDEISRILAELA